MRFPLFNQTFKGSGRQISPNSHSKKFMKPVIGRPSGIKISIDDAMLDESMTFESYYFAKSYPLLNVM